MEHVKKAAQSLPKSEVSYVQRLFVGVDEDTPSDEYVRIMLASNRIMNKICNFCGKKNIEYSMCEECCCTWYCKNSDCKNKDSVTHSKWCCKPDGPRDTGYMATVLIKTTPNGTTPTL